MILLTIVLIIPALVMLLIMILLTIVLIIPALVVLHILPDLSQGRPAPPTAVEVMAINDASDAALCVCEDLPFKFVGSYNRGACVRQCGRSEDGVHADRA